MQEPSNPKDGDIWQRNKSTKSIWKPCENCHTYRWTDYYGYIQGRFKICRVCSMRNAMKIRQEQKRLTGRGSNAVYEIDVRTFDTIDTELKAYALGFIVGDGSVTKDLDGIAFNLSREDVELLEFVKLALKSNHPIKETFSNGGPGKREMLVEQCSLDIWSTSLVQALVKLGMTPNKQTREILPVVPEHLQRHLIRGLFDADGGFHKGRSDGTWNFYIEGSEKLLNQVKEIFGRLVFLPEKCVRFGNGCHEFRVKSYRARVLAEWLYEGSTIRLRRKYELYQQLCSDINLDEAKLLAAMTPIEMKKHLACRQWERKRATQNELSRS